MKTENWDKAMRQSKMIPLFFTKAEKRRQVVILCKLLKEALEAK